MVVLALALVACEHYSPMKAKEKVLRQDLVVLRSALNLYTTDHDRRPQAMNDIVTGGYLRRIPIDPITGRSDTWVFDWSHDPKGPGIVDIHSGSGSISREGSRYSEW